MRHSLLNYAVLLGWTVLWLFISPSSAWCETLNLESVIDRALEHAWEIQIAEKGVDISKYGLMEARSAYYPTMSLRFDNEYVDFLGDGDSVVSVGDQVSANDASTFQHSFTLGLSYILYDFGARRLSVDNARREVAMASLGREQVLLETRLNVLESYGQCLQLFRQRQYTDAMVRLRKEIFKMLQSLRDAGVVGQVRLNSAAVELAEDLSLMDDLTDRLIKAVETLGYFTGQDYSLDDIVFSDLPAIPSTASLPDLSTLPQIKSIDVEIARVQAERSVMLREMLPNFGLIANYRMFGADQDNFGRSLESLSARDATVGLVARWEFFSGFRDVARLRQSDLKVEQLRLEKERQLGELQKQVRAASRIWQLADGARGRQGEREKLLKQSSETLDRLSEQRAMDRVDLVEQEIDLMEQELDMRITQMQRQLAGWQLRFWSEGQMP